MARYLPRDYSPIPDALLYSKADLVDVTRRIARNQNWIWANHGNVIAACGQEPMAAQTPAVTGVGELQCAYFAAPNRSATGSDQVRVRGYVNIGGTLTNNTTFVRLWQLLPGELAPTSDSPVNGWPIIGSGEIFFDFNARIRSGSDPIRFCLTVAGTGSNTATITMLSCTVTWLPNPASVLGESVEAWKAMSQNFVAPNRAASSVLWRAISNRTLRLLAENPRPIFSHSFLWPRISTAAAGAETRVGLWSLKHDGISTPRLWASFPVLVTGQNADVTFRLKVNGTLAVWDFTSNPGLVNGVYVKETWFTFVSMVIPAGDVKIEITAQCNVGATAPPTYCTNVGAVLLGFTARQGTRTAADLGLPGAELVPAAYQPLDESACVPGRSVVAQNDRLGRRAGPYYLVRNLIWLAANRTGHVLVADWLHRTQGAGFSQGGVAGGPGAALAGDGLYRNQTLFSDVVQAAPTVWFEEAPQSNNIVPWADRPAPTNGWNIKDAPGGGGAGHHYMGDVLGRFYCYPMNGGKIAAILRPDVLYAPRDIYATGSNPPGDDVDLEFYFDAGWRDQRVPANRWGMTGGFRTVGVGSFTPSGVVATTLNLRANTGTYGDIKALSRCEGIQAALHSAYIYEAPLTQTDLEALP